MMSDALGTVIGFGIVLLVFVLVAAICEVAYAIRRAADWRGEGNTRPSFWKGWGE
jgi:Na+-transporting methylmalonyl-CoA/oxaloacetate decarboxylase gamma subunit